VDQPTGSSKLCLSCHDGTIALEATIRGGGGGQTYIPPGATNLGTDLSDDHPVSFVYSSDLPNKDPQIKSPDSLPPEVQLDAMGELQCITCHDPHDNTFGNFLVASNERSNLCVTCHDITGWQSTVHSSSPALVRDADNDYLTQTGYATVTENGCLSCHRPHSAGGSERLFHFEQEELNCLGCHNGLVAQTNLTEEFNRISGHFVKDYTGIHDIEEVPDAAPMHVECIDCHNPHTVISRPTAQAPYASGALNGVSGVSAQGSMIKPVSYEYEVCFKCHGHNPDRLESTITRRITQTDTIMEFADQGNPSFHPIVQMGVNENVPSLIPGMDETSIIYCTDCHNSDPSSQVKGPHGSQYQYILARRYETADDTPEDISTYALCYECHDRESILNDESFTEHRRHIVDEMTPCSVCHDPHGISFSQGNSTNNTNLINFDISVVFPDPNTMRLEFEDVGTFVGQCYLECHDRAHSPESYRREIIPE
jgi:predicted CXXCH cytochrome family protein